MLTNSVYSAFRAPMSILDYPTSTSFFTFLWLLSTFFSLFQLFLTFSKLIVSFMNFSSIKDTPNTVQCQLGFINHACNVSIQTYAYENKLFPIFHCLQVHASHYIINHIIHLICYLYFTVNYVR